MFTYEDTDSLIVDLNNNDSLIVDLHNQDQDSRIVDLHKKELLCMYMLTDVALFRFYNTIIKQCDSWLCCKSFPKHRYKSFQISAISVIFKEDKDSLIVDLNSNDSLIVEFHNPDQDSRIVDLHKQTMILVLLWILLLLISAIKTMILVALLSTTEIFCVCICLLMLLCFEFTKPL